jgi:site-specific DNA-adenine methylase
MLGFHAKDAVFVIDDFCPTGSTGEIGQYHRKADQVFRGAGNGAGRGRLDRNGTLRPDHPPRGQILSTGEDVPRGQSLRARLTVVEVVRAEINIARLTQCQKQAADGLYAAENAAWIHWLAGRYEQLVLDLTTRRAQIRDKILKKGGARWHGRTPTAVADLIASWELYLRFAVESGAKTQEESKRLMDRAWTALLEVASDQTAYQADADPCRRFIDLLRSVLSSGRAYVTGVDGRMPEENPERWGWHIEEGPHVEYGYYKPRGNRIGWVDGDDLYLDPEAAYVAANALGESQGEPLPVSRDTLGRRLKKDGLLASSDDARQRIQVRKVVEGQRRYVLHFDTQTLVGGEETGPTGPTGPSDGNPAENGPVPAGRSPGRSENRPKEPGPKPWETDPDGPNGPVGPVKNRSTGLPAHREEEPTPPPTTPMHDVSPCDPLSPTCAREMRKIGPSGPSGPATGGASDAGTETDAEKEPDPIDRLLADEPEMARRHEQARLDEEAVRAAEEACWLAVLEHGPDSNECREALERCRVVEFQVHRRARLNLVPLDDPPDDDPDDDLEPDGPPDPPNTPPSGPPDGPPAGPTPDTTAPEVQIDERSDATAVDELARILADDDPPRKFLSRCAARKLRSALKTHGGKAYLAPKILALLPDHEVYVEPFAGGLSVLLNKRPCPVEVANDLNAALMRLYLMLRDRTDELLDRLAALPYDRETFEWSLRPGGPGEPELDAAVRFLVNKRFSRGGLGKDFAWSKRLRGGQPGDKNAWETALARVLPRIAERLAGVELRCQDAVELIREFDGPGVLIYADPPYVHSTRSARKIYDFEMDVDQHRRLLETIARCDATVAISGYANPLYDDALRGWRRFTFSMANNSGQTKVKQRRQEILWINR